MARVSVQQAAVNALVAYLKTQLAADANEITISDSWPEQSVNLPKKAITVILAGPRQDDDVGSYMRDISRVLVSGNVYRYRWTVKACRQPIQIDIWATNDVDREDLIANLDEALHQGEGVTLGTAGRNPFRDGILLNFLDTEDFTGTIDFTFEDGPDRDNAGDAAQRGEFRATQHGVAAMVLSLEAESPALIEAKLKMTLGEKGPSTTDTYTITATHFSQGSP